MKRPADMTDSELVETVIARLRVQGRRAVDEVEACVYRTPSGDGCAVGVLLSDELATSADAIRGRVYRVCRVDPRIAEWLGVSLNEDGLAEDSSRAYLLLHLQEIHDSSHNWNPGGLKPSAVMAMRQCLTASLKAGIF
jgi:hypothetical protein